LKRPVLTVIIANTLLLIRALILWRTFAQRLPWLGATTCISAIGTTGDLAGMLKNEAGLFGKN